MAYQINITDKKAYEWLQKLIANTLESPTSRPYQSSYEELVHWDEAFKECDRQREEAAAERKANTKRAPVKRKIKEPSQFDCENHPSYGGVRVPRTDCKKCWSIYKALHPMDYDLARRKFNMKQRKHA